MTERFRLGIDVGGTFTDAVLISEATGETQIAKVLSSPADPSIGFMEAVDRVLAKAKRTPPRHLLSGPRHDRCNECAHRRQDSPSRFYHYAGFSRYAGNRAPDTPFPLRRTL